MSNISDRFGQFSRKDDIGIIPRELVAPEFAVLDPLV